MKVFIAIELSDNIKNRLAAIQDKIISEAAQGKYTDIDNFHLTLHFIGEVSEDKAEEIKSAINRVAEGTEIFDLRLYSLGHFLKKQKYIIWIGVKENLDPLYKLNREIREELKEAHLVKEDLKFTPHITLGRQVKLNQTFDEMQEKIQVPELLFSVKSISLMESKREDGELVYKPIHNILLRTDR